jgi:hypothetical protein
MCSHFSGERWASIVSVLSDTPIASASADAASAVCRRPSLCGVRRQHDHVVEVPRVGDEAAPSIQHVVEGVQRSFASGRCSHLTAVRPWPSGDDAGPNVSAGAFLNVTVERALLRFNGSAASSVQVAEQSALG